MATAATTRTAMSRSTGRTTSGTTSGTTRRATAARRRGVRLTRRGRLAVTALVAALVAVALVALAGAAFGETARGSTSVVVRPGDTLWSVARAADPQADPRETIAELRQVNGLAAGASLVPGQVLVLP